MKYLMIISIAFLLMACGEDSGSTDLVLKDPANRAGDVELILNVAASDMAVCDALGYSDRIFLSDSNSYGFPDLDETNLLQIFIDYYDYRRTNTVVYEFEEMSDFPYIRVANTYRVFYHHELEQLLFNEGCVYDLTRGVL